VKADSEGNYKELKAFALKQGIALFGVAKFDPEEARSLLSDREGNDLPFAISMGVRLSRTVLEGIVDRPTLLYQWHYRQANYLLDRTAFLLSLQIQDKGARAMPIPASQIVDWKCQRAHLSHKHVARLAGHGWIGRNNLLVNPRFGAQVRYVTVLTDLPLKVDEPVEGDCGDCRACVEVCPAEALGSMPEEYDFHRCFENLKTFAREHRIGHYICGVCVRACPGKG